MLNIWAAATAIQPDGRVGVVGYCWGGTWVWLAGYRIEVGCVVAYYGRLIVDFLDEKPRCPVIMHFGADDATIPVADVDKIRAAHPDVPIYVHEGAGHGFNCDHRDAYRPAIAAEALERTLALCAENLKQPDSPATGPKKALAAIGLGVALQGLDRRKKPLRGADTGAIFSGRLTLFDKIRRDQNVCFNHQNSRRRTSCGLRVARRHPGCARRYDGGRQL